MAMFDVLSVVWNGKLPSFLEEGLEDVELLPGEGGPLPPLLLPPQGRPVGHGGAHGVQAAHPQPTQAQPVHVVRHAETWHCHLSEL